MKVRLDLPVQTRFYYPDLQVVCDSAGEDESVQGWIGRGGRMEDSLKSIIFHLRRSSNYLRSKQKYR